MKIALAELEQRFEEFKTFLKTVAGEEFYGFQKSKFFLEEEGYKPKVFQSASRIVRLNQKFWKQQEIGNGKVIEDINTALEPSVIDNFIEFTNNLINDWRLKDNFKKQIKNRNLEQILFDFYKNKIRDEQAFERLLEEKQPYNLIAYLFFIKDSQKYLPISQERFDFIFSLLGLTDFKTRGKASWENYQTFLDLNRQVREFLLTKDRETTLLDAHSFLWILGGKMHEADKKEAKPKTTTDIKNEEINKNSPKWDFPNELTNNGS
jgi:hypothetical protein